MKCFTICSSSMRVRMFRFISSWACKVFRQGYKLTLNLQHKCYTYKKTPSFDIWTGCAVRVGKQQPTRQTRTKLFGFSFHHVTLQIFQNNRHIILGMLNFTFKFFLLQKVHNAISLTLRIFFWFFPAPARPAHRWWRRLSSPCHPVEGENIITIDNTVDARSGNSNRQELQGLWSVAWGDSEVGGTLLKNESKQTLDTLNMSQVIDYKTSEDTHRKGTGSGITRL